MQVNENIIVIIFSIITTLSIYSFRLTYFKNKTKKYIFLLLTMITTILSFYLVVNLI